MRAERLQARRTSIRTIEAILVPSCPPSCWTIRAGASASSAFTVTIPKVRDVLPSHGRREGRRRLLVPDVRADHASARREQPACTSSSYAQYSVSACDRAHQNPPDGPTTGGLEDLALGRSRRVTRGQLHLLLACKGVFRGYVLSFTLEHVAAEKGESGFAKWRMVSQFARQIPVERFCADAGPARARQSPS